MRKQNPKSYEYIESLLPTENESMLKSRRGAESLGLGGISISAAEGSLVQFLVGISGAKKAIEIGTLTGLSAQYILKALSPDGQLWTLEKSKQHADLAADAVNDKRCHIVVGDAQEKLSELVSKGPFDAIFIDGNKAAYLNYFNWAVENIAIGGVIVADNVFLAGAVWGDQSQQKFNEKQVDVVRRMNLKAFSTEALVSTIIPTEEGLLICRRVK
ncbi:MAG: hypothetical protein A2622_06745 [Bdellovibrionales bacterium RIFCSPHIGHO2_01_FULL_40_29]|nr:MAG: hypothetical protein A2622_06745 [Bdellovibrionales bacterium RIFCSPHIGHO2_01_FULL_40_29]OFZ35138.1 MAG: hypothetical protein A3D17_07095 [Bdellovibrionales bacterium RIFCSPHIGHO2_02_FULL_40_15]